MKVNSLIKELCSWKIFFMSLKFSKIYLVSLNFLKITSCSLSFIPIYVLWRTWTISMFFLKGKVDQGLYVYDLPLPTSKSTSVSYVTYIYVSINVHINKNALISKPSDISLPHCRLGHAAVPIVKTNLTLIVYFFYW